jgi:hypothetical protein
MTRKVILRLALAGPNLIELVKEIAMLEFAGSGLPTRLSVDDVRKKPTEDWFVKWPPKCRQSVFAEWSSINFIALERDTIVKAAVSDYPLDPKTVLHMLTQLSFSIASFADIYPEWHKGRARSRYRAPSFGDMHLPHGWACAFKGEGHDRLVSRRWLDYGPWRLLRGANDTTLVQFHDVKADAETALAQAKPGHERMGISATGGFLQRPYHYSFDLGGLYSHETRKLKVIVHGREVTQIEMRDACAVRYYQALGPDRPVDNVAYIFMEEQVARAHLHELWLRELECWAIIDGREVQLDTDYHPPPEKPEWVRQIEERE